MTRRKIYTQGDLDGACFLYSLANAYTALTGEVPEFSRWDEAISRLSWPIDFLRTGGGTTDRYEKTPERLYEDANMLFSTLAGEEKSLSVSVHAEVATLEEVAKLVDTRSVVVLWYQGHTRHVQNGNHWVCAVAVEEEPLLVHVACSIRHSDDGRFNDSPYIETEHAESGRYSNDWITGGMETRIMKGFVMQIHRDD